jgi:hypothetical protein
MALAWKAGWVNALRGSNPLSSASGKTPLARVVPKNGGVRACEVQRDGSPLRRVAFGLIGGPPDARASWAHATQVKRRGLEHHGRTGSRCAPAPTST